MKRIWRLIGLAGVLCLASCSNKTAAPPKLEPLAASQTTPPAASSAEAGQALAAKDFFPDPLVASASTLKPVAGTHLIPPTTSAERVPQIETGRNDPFASLGFTPTVVAKPVVAEPAAQPVVATQPVSVMPAPVVQPVALPPEPPVLPVLPVPAVEVPRSAPVPPAPSLAETIEITGVVQVAGVTNVIVKVPDEHTSRPVAVGERLGNGRVLVKRVEMGLEPTVILEQGGREIARAIGSSNALVGAL